MTREEAADTTRLLADWTDGDQRALDQLAPRVYDELRRLAQSYMNRERGDHTLQATALVNEAYIRLIDQSRVRWKNGVHFVALAAQMMRRILVDHARGHRGAKRGGGAAKIPLESAGAVPEETPADVVEIDEALVELAKVDNELARIVEMRFFGGLKSEEIAEVMGVSVPTVTRRWRLAKAWLYRYMTGDETDA